MTLPLPAPEPWTHRQLVVNGLRLHYVEAGAGPLVVLLHGFPEFWYCWRHQLPALAQAGFRAVAVDLRGYNESDKPRRVRDYRLELLVQDVAGLIEQLASGVGSAPGGVGRIANPSYGASVVGHDWGGVIAWMLAMQRPDLVERLAVLNAPHPGAWQNVDLVQRLRSWYILFFQLPLLPEWLLQAGDFALVERMFRREPVHAEAFSREDIRRYKHALAQPGALTAAVNYYRALRFSRQTLHAVGTIDAPTLLIWGERDPHLGVRLTEGLQRWVPGIRVERLADSSHWVQNDTPGRVNELLVQFLREQAP